MIGSRALWCSLLGALACVLSACAGLRGEPAPSPLRTPTAEEAAQASCYMSLDGGWSQRSDLREARCFRDDECFGGMGSSSGERPACYKWATAADAPALRWSTTLTNPRPAADIPPPDAIYEGGFEETNDCYNEACTPPPVRNPVAAPIYAAPDASSPRVGTVSAEECVQPGGYRLRSAPVRGVVLETHNGFDAGDVIYLLAYQGEGFVDIWRRGETTNVEYDEIVVRWDAPPATPDPREGNWIWVTRANGEAGWANSFRDYRICE